MDCEVGLDGLIDIECVVSLAFADHVGKTGNCCPTIKSE